MNWTMESATPTQLERLTQIKIALKRGIIYFADISQVIDPDKQQEFLAAVESCMLLSPTKGEAGVFIGAVKKLLVDEYDSKIKSIEVE
jgi:hypothetical protein